MRDATLPATASGVSKQRRGPRLPLPIADAYLLRQVVESTFRGLTWFAGLLLAFAVITAVKKLAEQSIDIHGVIELLVYQMPRILLFTLPMSILYGTLQTFADLSGKGEIIALAAGGMSLRRMLYAPIAWGVFLALFAFWLQEAVVPRAEQKKKDVVERQFAQMSGTIENFHWDDQRPDKSFKRMIQAKSFDPKTKTLDEPLIQLFNDSGELETQIKASKAQWDQGTGKWVLEKAVITNLMNGRHQGGTLSTSGYSEVTSFDLVDPVQMGQKITSIRESLEHGDFELVSIADLMHWRAGLQRDYATAPSLRLQKLISGATFGIHDKIATPLICLALILVGAPLGLRPQRSSGGVAMGLSLAVLLLYYVLWTMLSQSGKGGMGNPYLLAYFPTIITTIIGVVLIAKKSH